jgi:hypothetical protein
VNRERVYGSGVTGVFGDARESGDVGVFGACADADRPVETTRAQAACGAIVQARVMGYLEVVSLVIVDVLKAVD